MNISNGLHESASPEKYPCAASTIIPISITPHINFQQMHRTISKQLSCYGWCNKNAGGLPCASVGTMPSIPSSNLHLSGSFRWGGTQLLSGYHITWPITHNYFLGSGQGQGLVTAKISFFPFSVFLAATSTELGKMRQNSHEEWKKACLTTHQSRCNLHSRQMPP